MSVNEAFRVAEISTSLSKGQEANSANFYKYPCNNIEEMSLYVLTMRSDKRAVATGVDATNYSPFQTLRSSPEVREFSKSIGLFIELAINLIEPKSVLLNQSVINTHLMTIIYKYLNADINIINGPYLHLYEKFCKDDIVNNNVPYKTIGKYEILSRESNIFDMIIVYADDIEGELDYVSSLVDSLSVGGTMLIVNSANQGSLYGAGNFLATPQCELHDFINLNENLICYHIPHFIGFSFVKKVN